MQRYRILLLGCTLVVAAGCGPRRPGPAPVTVAPQPAPVAEDQVEPAPTAGPPLSAPAGTVPLPASGSVMQMQAAREEADRLESETRRILTALAGSADPVAGAAVARAKVAGLRQQLATWLEPFPLAVQAAVAPQEQFLAGVEGLLGAGAALDEAGLARAVDGLQAQTTGLEASFHLQEALEASLQQLRQRYLQPLPREKVVYLTLDDGPDPSTTPRLLEILRQAGVKATFFVIGRRAAQYPDLVRAIAAAGHTVGNHTYTHDYSDIYASPEAFIASLDKTSDLIHRLTGQAGLVVRAPGGSYNKFDRRTFHLLQAGGYVAFDWTVDSEDAKGATTREAIVGNVVRQAAGQAPVVVLMHDVRGKEATVAALPEVIAHFRAQGYGFDVLPPDGAGLSQAARRVLPAQP